MVGGPSRVRDPYHREVTHTVPGVPGVPAAPGAEEPVLPDRAADDSDEGWGRAEGGSAGRDPDDAADYEAERPPHHDGRSSW